MTRTALTILALALAGCSGARPLPKLPGTPLTGSDGAAHAIAEAAKRSRATVVFFFSADCPCQRAHDARLRDLFARYADRDVAFFAVDSEAGASVEKDAAYARARGFGFPILIDEGGALADALGADFATYSLVLDGTGRVRYRGGVDSDKLTLHDDAALWLQNALDRVLAGASPDPAETKPLGCSLRRK